MAGALKRSLSTELVKHLNSPDNVTVRSDAGRLAFVLVVLGIVVTALVLFLTYDFRWGYAKTSVIAIFLVAGCVSIAIGIARLLNSSSSVLPSGFIVTPDYVVFSDDRSVEWSRVGDLINVDYRHHFNGRKYEYTTVSVSLPGQSRSFSVFGVDEAETAVEKIEEFKRNDLVRSSKPRSGATAPDFPEATIAPRWSLPAPAPILTAAIAIGILGSVGAYSVNEYFDDQLSWNKAEGGGRASSYREYLKGHSRGRWRDEASRRVIAFYDAAELKYREALSEDHDRAAVESLLALLRYVRESNEYQVGVSFERKAHIPADLTERLKNEFEVKHVLPLGSTFTDEEMKRREADLFAYLQSAFVQVFPDDVLEIVHDCSGECGRFVVRYETSFENTIYFDLKEKEIPEIDRTWAAGVLVNWYFTLTIPDALQPYSFDLESAPANEITYDSGETVEADQESFYDAVVASSFDDFRAHLVFNLGLGPDPHPEEANVNEK